MPFDAIPKELQSLPQWIVWRFEDIGAAKPTKVPYSINGNHANVNDAKTWCEFDKAVNRFNNGGYDGIGFVFTDKDPLAFIDLDDTEGDQVKLDRQLKIFKEFDSYSEISPSGKGLHIIVKGAVPQGRKRSSIEIYSQQRYATFTGNVYHNKPIEDRNDLLNQLWVQMGGGSPTTMLYTGDTKEKETDAAIIEKAKSASNGDKFIKLLDGTWNEIYPSQSEADLAFINIIAFFTQNRNQIERIFHASPLGQRLKAKRKDYLGYMINKSFDQILSQIDFEGFKIEIEKAINLKQENLNSLSQGLLPLGKVTRFVEAPESNFKPIVPASIPIPPGLMGELAQFIYQAAPRPVPEMALAGAMGLMAGICGRAYNISGTGLNQYILLIANTGCHAKGTKILMYDGSTKLVEEITIGDLLMGPDSQPRKVLNLARGRQQMVKIIPTKGEEFVVNLDHILSLIHTRTKQITNISVKNWIKQNTAFKHCYKLQRKSVEFNSKELPLDPWFLGAMIGDGQFGPRIALTSADQCIRDRARKIISVLDMSVVTNQVFGNKAFQDGYIKTVKSGKSGERESKLQLILKNLNLWGKKAGYKFIPDIYKTASKIDRMNMLAGLLDTDGHQSGNGYDYISKSKQLSEDVVFIARSLGYAAYITSCQKYSQNKTGGTYYRVSLSGDMSNLPLTLDYKKSQLRQQKKSVLVTGFKTELLEEDYFYGFSLDKDHLYLTADFTVHHNSGKEAMALGIDKLMNAIKLQVPTSKEFIGPAEIASGQSLVKHLNKTSACFVSLLGEFGLRLQSMSNPNSNSSETGLKRILLDLFNKSGHGQMFRGSIYADKEKNIDATQSPSFSILGESTPERFYGVLNEEMISEGLLPRFILIEYNGPRPPLNDHHLNAQPNMMLVDKLATLAANCEVIMHAKRVINVISNDEASLMFKQFDKFCDDRINNAGKNEVLRQLWNRAHIKALKIAALIAVGVNMADPLIIPEYVTWAINLVQNDIKALFNKFEAGEVGSHSSENTQINEVIRAIKDFIYKPWGELSKYGASQPLHDAKIIPYAYLSRRVISNGVFRYDKLGATPALKRVIQILIDSDKLREMSKLDMVAKFGTTQKAFVISNMKILE